MSFFNNFLVVLDQIFQNKYLVICGFVSEPQKNNTAMRLPIFKNQLTGIFVVGDQNSLLTYSYFKNFFIRNPFSIRRN